MHNNKISAEEALKKLKEGNNKYLTAETNPGDISPEIRKDTCENGQHPYAVIIACSDSRVPVEAIFSAGIGELFVIRSAGNTIGRESLGSIEYAVYHLGCQLVVVLGHTHCGAVGATISSESHDNVMLITDVIKHAIGTENDETKASCLNAQYSVEVIKDNIYLPDGAKVISALYDIESGKVNFDI